MDFDISQTLELIGKTFTAFLYDFLSFSREINDHSATITIALSVFGAIFAWLLYRHRTKRKLKVDVNLNPNASVNSKIWKVFLINKGYYKVYVKEVGLLHRDWWLGKNNKFLIIETMIEIEPGRGLPVCLTNANKNIEICPREISGAYAVDETGTIWRTRKRLKVVE